MMTRLEFLKYVAGLAMLGACGKDADLKTTSPDASPDGAGSGSGSGMGSGSGSAAVPGDCNMNGTTATIAFNHGHVLVVSKEDIAAGVDKTYDITGSSLHAHSVTITAAMFADLAQNTNIMTVSTTNVHAHDITVVCA